MKTDTAIKNQWALSSFGIVREYDTHKAVCEMQLVDNDKWSDSNPQWAQNAELIVAAVNACKEINADNPLNVAKVLPKMFEVLENARVTLKYSKTINLPNAGAREIFNSQYDSIIELLSELQK